MTRAATTLILGWGNPGRVDDGLGPAFIEALAKLAPPGIVLDSDLQGSDLVTPPGKRRGEYVAMIEAPRGTLTHHYRVDENDQVTMANLIVSTACSASTMRAQW